MADVLCPAGEMTSFLSVWFGDRTQAGSGRGRLMEGICKTSYLFILANAGISCILGENVVASRERARRSSCEMTPRRRGVILASGGRFGGGGSPRNDVYV